MLGWFQLNMATTIYCGSGFLYLLVHPRSNGCERGLRVIKDQHPNARISVIAHSFGTYIIGSILQQEFDIRIHRLILCGSVLPRNFAWEKVLRQLERNGVINECGKRDIWPVMAQSLSWGYGASGTHGFGAALVRDRFHDMTYSQYFSPEFVEKHWVPFIQDGRDDGTEFEASISKSPWWMSVLEVLPIKWLLLAGSLIVSAWLAYSTVLRDLVGKMFTQGGEKPSLSSLMPSVDVNEPPQARLIENKSDIAASLLAWERAADWEHTTLELTNWDEIKSKEERESLLDYTDQFNGTPLQVVSDPIPADGENKTARKGIAFSFEVKRGPHAKQLILRDVFIDVVAYHSVAPNFRRGAGFSKNPVIAIEMCNPHTQLPWKFQAKWISDSSDTPFHRFDGVQVSISESEWKAYNLKLLPLDRGVYRFNIYVVLQQDDDPPITYRITDKPYTVGFFSQIPQTHPDYQFLHNR